MIRVKIQPPPTPPPPPVVSIEMDYDDAVALKALMGGITWEQIEKALSLQSIPVPTAIVNAMVDVLYRALKEIKQS